MLPRLYDRLPLRVPELVAEGCREDGWSYVIVEKLPGVLLESCWASLARDERAAILEQIGATMAAVHAVPLEDVATLAPEWSHFIRGQARNCRNRHSRYRMPGWLLEGLDELVGEWLPSVEYAEERVILTGEYTPFNLLLEHHAGRVVLAGMFDFGDAMVGPREYDLLGPSLFSCGGDPALVGALLRGYRGEGTRIDHPTRMRLVTLAVLHRYANLDFQVRIPAWRERARSLEALATLIWPENA